MKIGANIDLRAQGPEEWTALLRGMNATAAIAPVDCATPGAERAAFRRAAEQHGITIAEVGVWNNPLSPDSAQAAKAIRYAQGQLALAEELGALCCVNVSGARGAQWDGCYADNLSEDTYALVVDTVREIIDAVRPKHTFYTLEPTAWMVPHTPEEYLRLLRDVDRPAFAVHMDYTNFITGVHHYTHQKARFEEVTRLLGPYVKSVHVKDIAFRGSPCRIQEVLPGEGSVDFAHLLRLAASLGPGTPLLVEHLQTYDECRAAIRHIRGVAEENGVEIN